MFELVPSKDMRDYFKSVHFEFSDFEKATLIWNAPKKTRNERLEALKELADTTLDDVLKKQIIERLEYEEKAYNQFIDNSSSEYVYVIEDGTMCSCGFFAYYDVAYNFACRTAKEDELSYDICKQLILKEDNVVVPNVWKVSSYLGVYLDDFSEYCGDPIARMRINETGEIIDLGSNELLKEKECVDYCHKDRFEFHFVKFPYGFPVGIYVKNIFTGEYGVVDTDYEIWENFLNRIESAGLYVDYIDSAVTVYFLGEDGVWRHDHINPLFLEIEFPPQIEGDEVRDTLRHATEAFVEYLGYSKYEHRYSSEHYESLKQSAADQALKFAREYAQACRNQDKFKIRVERAKKLEDIMW